MRSWIQQRQILKSWPFSLVTAGLMCGRFQAVVAVGITAMTISFTPALLEQARRNAKRLAAAQNLKTHEAQDQIAQSYGCKNWSLFAKRCNSSQVQQADRSIHPIARRFHAHGDLAEDDSGLYFCTQCDIFGDALHFSTPHRRDHAERLQQDLKTYSSWAADTSNLRYRPSNAFNLFTQELSMLVAEQNARAASRSRFYRWLELQRDRDDPVGDLAYDITKDKKFPVDASLRKTQEYLESKWVSEPVMEALKAAWSEFSAAKRVG